MKRWKIDTWHAASGNKYCVIYKRRLGFLWWVRVYNLYSTVEEARHFYENRKSRLPGTPEYLD